MSRSAEKRASPIMMLAPVAFVLIGYSYLLHFPQQRDWNALRARRDKMLSSEDEVRREYAQTQRSLASARSEQQGLERQLQTLLDEQRRLEALRTDGLGRLRGSVRPAETMDSLTRLLERHGLDVVQIDGEDAGQTAGPSVLQPLLQKLGGKPAEVLAARRSYRLQLQGPFEQLRQALAAIHREAPDVIPLALELEASEARSSRRRWSLTLLV